MESGELFRRFSIVQNGEKRDKIYQLMKDKGLTHEELELLVTGVRINDEPEPVPFKEYKEELKARFPDEVERYNQCLT